ncbi:acyltransferase family protein [Lysobacter enzymogenes]|uniref:acyltransferase family protein n=1 Tax=Lysobacter enzymogenes TaxID=69 RepID=UPI001A960CEB|nr:acyltransferase [Lysobacter enzymogenes]QQP98039.1 acyltransferase [Lysobacter enzymogenes]
MRRRSFVERAAANPIAIRRGGYVKHHRYHELDALRAIAALGVICWHYVHTYHIAPFGAVLAPFYGRGMLMVDFFFVLSGFVLARAFMTGDRAQRFAANVRARIARIYPLHLLMLCAVAAMQWRLSALGQAPFVYAYNDGYHFVLNLLLLNSSGLQQGFSFNAPSWSISTEFLVNLLFLAVIAAPRNIARGLIWLLLAAALATMAARGVINSSKALGWIDNDVVRTAAGFFFGVVLHWAHRALGENGPGSGARWPWDLLAVALMAGVCWYLASGQWSNLGDMLTCYLAFPALILAVVRSAAVRAALRLGPMVRLGEMSYSIYLTHFPLMLALHLWTAQTGATLPVAERWFFPAFIALVLAVSLLTYRLIEEPAKRLLGDKRSGAARSAAATAK